MLFLDYTRPWGLSKTNPGMPTNDKVESVSPIKIKESGGK